MSAVAPSDPPSTMPPPRGALRVATVFGINVHVHWAWALVAVLMVQWRADQYSGLVWNVLEYVGLFGIVLLHEFGHALACKSVKGQSEHVLLWPLGGVAYVRPPQRPGATLWVSAAGPLVNVILIPVTVPIAIFLAGSFPESDLTQLTTALAFINVLVLVFNVLPVYPLDGGKMLRSLLWFQIGPHKSLFVATAVGLAGSVVFLLGALFLDQWFLAVVAVFTLMSSWGGFSLARARLRTAQMPRRMTHRCPACQEPPPVGPCWPCPACQEPYDAFEDGGTCPRCRNTSSTVRCPYCGEAPPLARWFAYTISDG